MMSFNFCFQKDRFLPLGILLATTMVVNGFDGSEFFSNSNIDYKRRYEPRNFSAAQISKNTVKEEDIVGFSVYFTVGVISLLFVFFGMYRLKRRCKTYLSTSKENVLDDGKHFYFEIASKADSETYEDLKTWNACRL
tara:strand:- start:380 stop:790 length:411 start_codon:yes stop_codon:yes gene_type:complete